MSAALASANRSMRIATAPGTGESLVRTGGTPLPAILFVLALFIPVQIYVGDLRLSAYRITLLALVIPAFLRVANGDDIRWRTADVLILLHCAWMAIALLATGSSIATAGIFVIETAGPWFIARAYVRDMRQFRSVVKALFWAIALSLPFAIYEATTRDPILLSTLGKFLRVLPNVPHEQRFGLDRVQYVFDHPILYGLFCSTGVTLAVYMLGAPEKRRSWFRGGIVALATFLSLSSGALVCAALQLALMLYDLLLRSFRARWTVFLWTGAALYAALELASDRTVPQLLIPVLAMNQHNAWSRLLVNDAAINDILASPFIGYGLNAWVPDVWLPTVSIDNFWLVTAFRSGIPGVGFLLGTVLAVALAIGRAPKSDPVLGLAARALVITIASFSLAISTVHLWNASYCMFIFLLAVGLWIPDVRPERPEAQEQSPAPSGSGAAPLAAKPTGAPRYRRDFGEPVYRRRPEASPYRRKGSTRRGH